MRNSVLAAASAVAVFVAVPAGAVGFIDTLGGDGRFALGPAPFCCTIDGPTGNGRPALTPRRGY